MNSNRLNKYTVFHENSEEYHLLKREVFGQNTYYFETDSLTPYIIDAGAHIGLSTLYFKQLYPQATCICLEPNPHTYALLEKNVFENQLTDVTTLAVALTESGGPTTLHIDATYEEWFSSASLHKGAWSGAQQTEPIAVEGINLASLITQPVDLLKLDIEGAEQSVLTAAAGVLSKITLLHIEFHPHPTQSLAKLVELLERTHEVHVYKGTSEVAIKKATGLTHIVAQKRGKK